VPHVHQRAWVERVATTVVGPLGVRLDVQVRVVGVLEYLVLPDGEYHCQADPEQYNDDQHHEQGLCQGRGHKFRTAPAGFHLVIQVHAIIRIYKT